MQHSNTSSSPITTPARLLSRTPRALPQSHPRWSDPPRLMPDGTSQRVRRAGESWILMRPGVQMSERPGIGPSPVPVLAAGGRPQAPIMQRLPETGWPAFHEMIGRVAVLERTPVFFALPEGTLRALARRLRRFTVAGGEMIICQSEPGDTLFFIEQGRCRMVIERDPGVVTVALLTEGDIFGEGACLQNKPQQASVYAQTDCTLLSLDRQSLHLV